MQKNYLIIFFSEFNENLLNLHNTERESHQLNKLEINENVSSIFMYLTGTNEYKRYNILMF